MQRENMEYSSEVISIHLLAGRPNAGTSPVKWQTSLVAISRIMRCYITISCTTLETMQPIDGLPETCETEAKRGSDKGMPIGLVVQSGKHSDLGEVET